MVVSYHSCCFMDGAYQDVVLSQLGQGQLDKPEVLGLGILQSPHGRGKIGGHVEGEKVGDVKQD